MSAIPVGVAESLSAVADMLPWEWLLSLKSRWEIQPVLMAVLPAPHLTYTQPVTEGDREKECELRNLSLVIINKSHRNTFFVFLWYY